MLTLSAPWICVDGPRLSAVSVIRTDDHYLVWGITDDGHVMCRIGVSTQYPGGNVWKQVPMHDHINIKALF